MDAFLILGQIPGTDYQLTFLNILAGCGVIIMLWFSAKGWRNLKPKIKTYNSSILSRNSAK